MKENENIRGATCISDAFFMRRSLLHGKYQLRVLLAGQTLDKMIFTKIEGKDDMEAG